MNSVNDSGVRPRTALWVVGAGEVAGVGRHVLDVARAGIPGWNLKVLAPPGPLRESLPADLVVGVEFGPSLGFLASARATRRVASESGASIVHAHLAWADFVAAAARPTAALVSTEHGIAGDPMTYANSQIDATATGIAHRWRLRRLRALICVSHATERVVRERWHPPGRLPMHMIPNGIDRLARTPSAAEERPQGSSDAHVTGSLTVGYLGRFAPEKRVDLLIRAFHLLVEKLPSARLSLAGAGVGEPALRQLVAELSLTDRVDFVGWVDAQEWLAGIEVVCLPSVWENCSYALLESLASGVGVVAAPVGGNPQFLPAHALADPRNVPEMARALRGQLLAQTTRPTLPDCVPTVEQMTEQLGRVYEVAGDLRRRPTTRNPRA